jgi:colicin import membrane protein
VRRARTAAAAKPALAPRITAAEAKQAQACAGVLGKPYELNLPARTVGKRVRETAPPTAEEAAAVAAARLSLAQAEVAAAKAAGEAAARKRDAEAAKRQEVAADAALAALSPPAVLLQRPCAGKDRDEWFAALQEWEKQQRKLVGVMAPQDAWDTLIDARVQAAQAAAHYTFHAEEIAHVAEHKVAEAAAAVEWARQKLRDTEDDAAAEAAAAAADAAAEMGTSSSNAHRHIRRLRPCLDCVNSWESDGWYPTWACFEKKCACPGPDCTRYESVWDRRKRKWVLPIDPLQDGMGLFA